MLRRRRRRRCGRSGDAAHFYVRYRRLPTAVASGTQVISVAKCAAAEGITRAQVAVLLAFLAFRWRLVVALEVVARRTPVDAGTASDTDAGRAGLRAAMAAAACLYHARRSSDEQGGNAAPTKVRKLGFARSAPRGY